MASDSELFFELNDSVFVQSVASPNQIRNPVWYADDVKPLLWKLVRRISPDAVEVVDLTGVTIQVAVGAAAASPTVYTSATSGTVNADGFLAVSLPFNLAAVQSALGSAFEIYPTLEIKFVGSTERYSTTCTIRQRLITGTLQDPAAPGIATTLEEVMSIMVPRDGSNTAHPCSSVIFKDEDTGLIYKFTCRAGEFHGEQIS